MVTGDAPATAAIIAKAVGLDGAICPTGPIPASVRPEEFAVFAGILQGIVLTKPGLEGVVAAVKEGRMTFQRILTYTLNSVTKKIVQVLFLAAGLIITGDAIPTPMLMVIIMVTGDFLGMSLTTDNVRPSPRPNAWRVGNLTIAGVFMGLSELVFCTAVLAIGKFRLGLGMDTLRTLAFVVIVFGNQATTYTNRTRQRLWSTRPSHWLVLSSVVDLSIASMLASFGLAMVPLPLLVLSGTFAAAVVFALIVDVIKIPVFSRLKIAQDRGRMARRCSLDCRRKCAIEHSIPITARAVFDWDIA